MPIFSFWVLALLGGIILLVFVAVIAVKMFRDADLPSRGDQPDDHPKQDRDHRR